MEKMDDIDITVMHLIHCKLMAIPALPLPDMRPIAAPVAGRALDIDLSAEFRTDERMRDVPPPPPIFMDRTARKPDNRGFFRRHRPSTIAAPIIAAAISRAMFVAADVWYDSPLFTWMSDGAPMFGDWAKPMHTFLHYGWGWAGFWAAVSLAGVSAINVLRDSAARRPVPEAEPVGHGPRALPRAVTLPAPIGPTRPGDTPEPPPSLAARLGGPDVMLALSDILGRPTEVLPKDRTALEELLGVVSGLSPDTNLHYDADEGRDVAGPVSDVISRALEEAETRESGGIT